MRMTESIKKSRKKEYIDVNVIALFVFIILTILDILLVLICGFDVTISILNMILFNVALSLCALLIYRYLGKISLYIMEILLFSCIIVSITEIIVYKTFDTFIAPHLLLNNVKGVLNNFSSELFSIVLSNNIFILFAVILYFSIVFFLNVHICIPTENSDVHKNGRFKLHSIFYAFIISILIVLSIVISKDAKNFSANVPVNGLKISLIREICNRRDDFKILNVEKNDDNDNDTLSNSQYNMLDIDYNALDVSNMPEITKTFNYYISESTASKKNEYTGVFKGKNLILICAEAFSSFAVDEELTPTLYRLINKGFRFTDYYVPSWGGSTISGEFAFLTGLIPQYSVESLKQVRGKNMCYTLPRALKREGYVTGAFHNGGYRYYDRNLSHGKNLGFDFYLANGNGIDKITGSWADDIDLIVKTFENYHKKTPFCMYYMTLSGHAFYNDNESKKVQKYIGRVKERYGDKYPDQVNNYICGELYLEDALKELLAKLEEYDMMNDTVICMTADHYPYGLYKNSFTNDIDYLPFLYEKDNMTLIDRDKNMPILWCGSLEGEQQECVKEISVPTSSIDLTPTLLNLYGIDFDSRLLAGRDVFSDAEAFVPYNNGQFITKEGRKEGTIDKRRYTSYDGSEANADYIKHFDDLTYNKNTLSKFVVDNDYYGYLFNNDRVSNDIKSGMSLDDLEDNE